MRFRRKTAAILSLMLALALALGGQAGLGQAIRNRSKMVNYASTFGLQGTGVKVQETDFEVNGKSCSNILWPGETASISFFVRPSGGYSGPIRFDVIQYGTRAVPGDQWAGECFRIADVGSTTANVNLPPEGGFVQVQPTIGDRFGGYAIVLDIPGKGRFFGATLCRAMEAEPGRVFMPTFAMDLGWSNEESPAVFNSFKKMGIKGARTEGGYGSIDDAHPDWALENNITLMLCVGAASTPMEWEPLGRGRPWLTADGSMMNGKKTDLAWMPQYDPQFQAYLTDVLTKWGWPKGPVNAVELWNEPWDGVSISGWGADIPRYRQLYRVMADAVLAARKSAGVRVMIGGTCSSTNTRDKLFCDGTEDFLNILDFVSIHYQSLAADPALQRDWMNRTGDYGRVRVWDTESWIANTDDRVAAVIASMRSMGQDRTAGVYYVFVNDSQNPVIEGQHYQICQVWAPGAAIAATNQFIGQREFKQILFKNGLPWVFEFNGLPGQPGKREGDSNPDDSTIVIVGDLTQTYEPGKCLYRSVAIKPDAKLEIPDGNGTFILYDFYGNPVPSKNGTITVPVNGLGYFLRTNGSPGSFAKLEAAVKTANLSGIDPVEIVARDMTAPLSTQPAIRIALTNVLNRPITGQVTASISGLTLAPADQAVSLDPNETREFSFMVQDGQPTADNNYPLQATFTGADGTVAHSEVVHVNYISKRTIDVSADLSQWDGAIPQTMAGAVGASMTEKAYLPFKDFGKDAAAGKVKAYLGYDDRFFYFAAQVPLVKPTIRFATRDDDSYFYPDTVTDKGEELTWPAGLRHYTYRKNYDLPAGHNVQIAFNVIPEDQKPAMLPYPAGTMPHFCTFPDTDYEFALNQCVDGSGEIFCLDKPGAPRKNFFPRQPKAPIDGGPVGDPAKLVFNGNVLECAIPWSFMPEVQQAIQSGKTIKFTFRSNEGGAAELAAGRSGSKINAFALHPDWTTHWGNELEFGSEK